MAIDVNFIRSKTRTDALVESMTTNKGGIYFPLDSSGVIMGGREYGLGSSDLLLKDVTNGRIRNFSFDENNIGEPRKDGNLTIGYAIDYSKLTESGWEILGYNQSNVQVGTNPAIDYVDKDCSGLPQVSGHSYIPHSERALKITLKTTDTQFGLYQKDAFSFPEQGKYLLTFDICASGGGTGKYRMFLVSQETTKDGDLTVPYFGSDIANFQTTPVWDTIYVPVNIKDSVLLGKSYTPMLVIEPGSVGDSIILDHFRLTQSMLHKFDDPSDDWEEY